MPYVKREDRVRVPGHAAKNPGHLNYLITMLCKRYWEENRSYQGINDIVGALEGAKLEFYRRVAVPYEDGKITENGDVY